MHEINWDEINKKYPDLEEFLEKTTKSIYNAIELQNELDERFPVEGFEWDCDPNEFYDTERKNQFYLVPVSKRALAEKRCSDALQKQLQCVDGIHHFVRINYDVEWCSFCGTIKYFDELKYPENPHFLPHKN